MLTETEFMEASKGFLEEIGADLSAVDPDTHLIDAGVLDSLAILAFLDFLENRCGGVVQIEQLEIDSIATLNNAYKLLLSQT
ncbi:phosphopantetheine-binding protein [Actinospica robiniae]|uniref:phosphopantetheine-binding protein n=1 Tax=Actinospica robiniae TaxID=304901 RepID=UPI0004066DAA|nr:acyl carrier protein [Actinospica robiniae]